MPEGYEVIVIGGGPAGSTACPVPAVNGRRAVVLEKEKFPRFRDCLMGHLFREFQPLFEAVSKFADVPAPLPHGTPCC